MAAKEYECWGGPYDGKWTRDAGPYFYVPTPQVVVRFVPPAEELAPTIHIRRGIYCKNLDRNSNGLRWIYKWEGEQ